MTRVLESLTPQAGIAAAAAVAIMTIGVDLYHARPAIDRWLAQQPPVISDTRSAFASLDVPLETSMGDRMSLADTQGHVRIATMFYAHCPTVCPLAIESLQRLEANLTTSERDTLQVMLLSLDPARDDPATLRAFAAERKIDDRRWLLARTEPESADIVASALSVQHEPATAGEINHNATLILLNAQGRELARSSTVDAKFVYAVRQAIQADSRT